jgi:hypothetical protein
VDRETPWGLRSSGPPYAEPTYRAAPVQGHAPVRASAMRPHACSGLAGRALPYGQPAISATTMRTFPPSLKTNRDSLSSPFLSAGHHSRSRRGTLPPGPNHHRSVLLSPSSGPPAASPVALASHRSQGRRHAGPQRAQHTAPCRRSWPASTPAGKPPQTALPRSVEAPGVVLRPSPAAAGRQSHRRRGPDPSGTTLQ